MAVKKTLAASLHEVAKILGSESLVEEELVPVFEDMIQVWSFPRFTASCRRSNV